MKDQDLKKDHLLPGQMVSKYYYILQAPDRIYHAKGKSYSSDIFSGGRAFIEHVSSYMSIKHQVAIHATEKLRQKPPLRGRLKFTEWRSRDTTLIMGSSIPLSLWKIC